MSVAMESSSLGIQRTSIDEGDNISRLDVFSLVLTLSNRPLSELSSIAALHGIEFPNIVKNDYKAVRHMLLKHFLKAECYKDAKVSSVASCEQQRGRMLDSHAYIQMLFRDIITCVDVGAPVLRHLSCESLDFFLPPHQKGVSQDPDIRRSSNHMQIVWQPQSTHLFY